MRKYPNPHEYMEQRIQELAQRDVERLKRAGLTPTETLLHALSERASQEANEGYMQEVHATLEHNIKQIVHEEQKLIQRIRRKSTRVAYLIFAPLALVLAALAGYSFSQQVPIMGIVYCASAVMAMATLRTLCN